MKYFRLARLRRVFSRRVILTLALLPLLILPAGCQKSETRQAGDVESPLGKPPAASSSKTPLAVIFEDQAMLKGGSAVLGGKVQNTSDAELKDLYVEVQLKPRGGGTPVIREVTITPASLRPGESGSYSTTVSNREWGSAGVFRLKSRGRESEIAFKSEPGAERPPERIANETRVIVVQRSKSKGGDDFINSPDNPEAIR